MAGEGTSFWTTIPGILTALTGAVAAVGSLVTTFNKVGLLGKRRAAEAEDRSDGASGKAAKPTTTDASTPNGTETAPPGVITLRSAPAVLSEAKVEAMLVRLDCFEQRRNPAGKGLAHRWTARTIGDAVVVEDATTGLTWQKVASPRPLVLEKAVAWVDELNGRRFAGFTDWRLPTAEEAMTLVEPEAVGEYHIAPVLGRGGPFIWTADRPLEGGGWVVYYYDAILTVEPEGFNAWARAVRPGSGSG